MDKPKLCIIEKAFCLALPWVRYQSACLSFKIYLSWDIFLRALLDSRPGWSPSVLMKPLLHLPLRNKSSQEGIMCHALCSAWDTDGTGLLVFWGEDGKVIELLKLSVICAFSYMGVNQITLQLPVHSAFLLLCKLAEGREGILLTLFAHL